MMESATRSARQLILLNVAIPCGAALPCEATGGQMSQTNLIFIGIKGTVVALDRATGSEVWRSGVRWVEFRQAGAPEGDPFRTTPSEAFRPHAAACTTPGVQAVNCCGL